MYAFLSKAEVYYDESDTKSAGPLATCCGEARRAKMERKQAEGAQGRLGYRRAKGALNEAKAPKSGTPNPNKTGSTKNKPGPIQHARC